DERERPGCGLDRMPPRWLVGCHDVVDVVRLAGIGVLAEKRRADAEWPVGRPPRLRDADDPLIHILDVRREGENVGDGLVDDDAGGGLHGDPLSFSPLASSASFFGSILPLPATRYAIGIPLLPNSSRRTSETPA